MVSSAVAADTIPDDSLRVVIELTYQQKYAAADSGVSRLIAAYPSDPAGPFWHMALVQMLIYDSGEGALADSFFADADRTAALCRRRLRQDGRDLRARLYLGMELLNRAQFLGWQQKAGPAFKAMFAVVPELTAVLAADSMNPGACFGLGMVEFFKTRSKAYTLGLILFGSRRKAYALVRRAAAASGPFQTNARFSLVYMLKEDGKYAEVVQECRTLLAFYPGSRSALRMMRDAWLDWCGYRQTIAWAQEIERSIRESFPDNRYGLAENWLKMASAYEKLGQRDSVAAACDRITAWESSRDSVPWLANYVREARQLRKRSRK